MTMILRTRRKRTRNIATLAISIVIIAYYVIGISQNQFLPKGSQALDKKNVTPDSTSTGVVIKRFNADGELHYMMNTHQADFFAAKKTNQLSSQEQDHLRLLEPQIIAYKKGKPNTSIAANLAYLSNNGDIAELVGNVKVNESASQTEIETQSLTLNVDSHQALSQSPITIKTPTSTTHATGFQGNLTDQRWRLLSEVKSVVQP